MRKSINLLVCLCVALLLTGCKIEFKGSTQINRIEFIRVVGIDKGNDSDTVLLSIATQRMEASGGTAGSQQKQSEIRYSEGNTVFEAVRNYWNSSDKRPFWGHLEYILIGEEAAKEGILKYIDAFCRDPEIRLNSEVFVVDGGKACEVVKKANSETKFIFDRLAGIQENQWGQSLINEVDLMEVMYILDTDYLSIYLPCIKLTNISESAGGGDKVVDIKFESFAIFEGDKLTGYLKGKMGRGLNWLRNRIRSGVIIIESPKGGNISLEIIESDSRLEPKIVDGELTINVKIKLSSNISEIQSQEDIFSPSVIESMENLQEQVVKDEVENIIRDAQERKLDYIGAGYAVYHKYPIKWEDIYIENWKELFSKLKFNVAVDSRISRTYDIKQPNRSESGGIK